MQRAHSWKQSGEISLWYYTENDRNYPGWHMTTDELGSASMVMLLDALLEDNTSASRSLFVKSPSKVQLAIPNNKSGLAAWRSPKKLVVAYSPNANEWSLPLSEDVAVLTFGSDWHTPLRKGISNIPIGLGDYSIGSNNGSSAALWFWPSRNRT